MLTGLQVNRLQVTFTWFCPWLIFIKPFGLQIAFTNYYFSKYSVSHGATDDWIMFPGTFLSRKHYLSVQHTSQKESVVALYCMFQYNKQQMIASGSQSVISLFCVDVSATFTSLNPSVTCVLTRPSSHQSAGIPRGCCVAAARRGLAVAVHFRCLVHQLLTSTNKQTPRTQQCTC